MADYSNTPDIQLLPPIAPESKPYFAVVMLVFAVWFMAALHYNMHVSRHGFPPFWVLTLKQFLERLRK